MPRRRSAFTLIELLVVVAIVGVLIGLTLAAVQRVRESSNRLSCTNNLKQLGIALQGYHDSYGKLPPAVLMPYANDDDDRTNLGSSPFGPNWLVFLLPHVEQGNLFQQANTKSYPGTNNTANFASYNLTWRSVRGTKIKSFICPSDTGHDVAFTDPGGSPPEGGWARGNYAASDAVGDTPHHIGGISAPSEDPFIGMNKGPVMTINYGARFAEITDGLSTTFMVHEVRVGVNALDRRGTWALGFPGASMVNGGQGVNTVPNNREEQADQIEGCSGFWYPGIGSRDGMGCENIAGHGSEGAQARSRHSGGVNACFADGHVQFIRNAISPQTWAVLQCRNDGLLPDGDY